MTRLELAYPRRCPIAKALLTHHFGRCRGCVLTTHFHLCYIPVFVLLLQHTFQDLSRGFLHFLETFFSKDPTPVLHSQWQAVVCGDLLPLTYLLQHILCYLSRGFQISLKSLSIIQQPRTCRGDYPLLTYLLQHTWCYLSRDFQNFFENFRLLLIHLLKPKFRVHPFGSSSLCRQD